MLYLIGGVARAGKSTAAEAFMRTAGVSCLGVDCIKMAFSRAMPEPGIDPQVDDRDIRDALKDLNVLLIRGEYDGSIDTGYLDNVRFVPTGRAK